MSDEEDHYTDGTYDGWQELSTNDHGDTIDETGRIVNEDGSEPSSVTSINQMREFNFWKSVPLPNSNDNDLFVAIVTAQSGRQLIAQCTTLDFAKDIEDKHNRFLVEWDMLTQRVKELEAERDELKAYNDTARFDNARLAGERLESLHRWSAEGEHICSALGIEWPEYTSLDKVVIAAFDQIKKRNLDLSGDVGRLSAHVVILTNLLKTLVAQSREPDEGDCIYCNCEIDSGDWNSCYPDCIMVKVRKAIAATEKLS